MRVCGNCRRVAPRLAQLSLTWQLPLGASILGISVEFHSVSFLQTPTCFVGCVGLEELQQLVGCSCTCDKVQNGALL